MEDKSSKNRMRGLWQAYSSLPRSRKALLVWSIVVVAWTLIILFGFATSNDYLQIASIPSWPAFNAASWLGVFGLSRLPALMILSLFLMAYHAFLHLGLLLAMLKWEGRWLLIEVGTLVILVGLFFLFHSKLAEYLLVGVQSLRCHG